MKKGGPAIRNDCLIHLTIISLSGKIGKASDAHILPRLEPAECPATCPDWPRQLSDVWHAAASKQGRNEEQRP